MEQEALMPVKMPLENKIFVLLGQHALTDKMLKLTAALCLRQTVTVLDCGNRADMYAIARHLRPFTRDPVGALNKIRLSRAFTGYQTVAMFEAATTAPLSESFLVLDILPTFLDEDLKLEDARRLFDRALSCLQVLSQHAPVIISAKPIPSIAHERKILLDTLRNQADFYWEEPQPLPAGAVQNSLFA